MREINQADVILDAFVEEENKKTDWYKERLALCNACDHNTANGSMGNIVKWAVEKLKKSGRDYGQCDICKCIVSKKCAEETEVCALRELGQAPKWNKRKIETLKVDKFNLENLNPKYHDIYLSEDGQLFVVDLGDIPVNYGIIVWFKIINKDQLKVVEEREGYYPIRFCSCMMINTRYDGDGKTEFKVTLNTPIAEGPYQKNIEVDFGDEDHKQTVVIQIKANVNA